MSKYVETHAKESFTNFTFLGDVKAVKQNKSVNASIHLVMMLRDEGCMHGIQMTRIVASRAIQDKMLSHDDGFSLAKSRKCLKV